MTLRSVIQDLFQAWRALQHARGYSAWVVGSLALGVAVTIAALALLNATLLLPFPAVIEQERLARVSVSRSCGRADCWTRMASQADYAALREGLSSVQPLTAYTMGEVAIALPEARAMRAILGTASYFETLGVRAVMGRVFDASDEQTAAAVAVIAHRTWTREFAADPSIVGRTIRVADQFVQIVGIAPPFFVGIDRDRPGAPRSMSATWAPDIWLPLWIADRVLPVPAEQQRSPERSLGFVGRLRDGVELPQLQAEATLAATRLAASYGDTDPQVRAEVGRVWRVNPRNWRVGIVLIMPIPILVLAIACVNAANLMLARGSQRQRELAIRLAIGAGRGRIIRQLLCESAILALVATSLAAPLAWWAVQLASTPLYVPIPFDPTLVALTVVTAAATTIAFGLAPALRVSAQQPSTTLGSVGARTDARPGQSRLRQALIVGQVALSLGLLATGSQLVSTVRAQAVSGGTPADHLLIARFALQSLTLAPGEVDRFYRDVLEGAVRLPGVAAAGIARHTGVWTFGQGATPGSIMVWRADDRPEEGQVTLGGYAGGELFEAVGLRVIAGRGFSDADRQIRPQVAIVNESAARTFSGPIVGSTIRVAPRGHDFNSSREVRVVGVIESAIEPRLEQGEPPAPKVYLPSSLEPEPALALYLRTTGVATTVAPSLRELVSRLDPRVPIQEIGSLEQINERSYATQLWLARAAAVLGAIGLLLATAGLYGVSSYVVAMRSREMAIRIAVGARPGAILAMVLAQSMRLAATGLAIGGTGAVVASRLIQSEYHGIHDIDGTAFGGAIALFLAAMLLASAVPALRASRVDPVESLRH
jgi:putative ABC transport system permease protein